MKSRLLAALLSVSAVVGCNTTSETRVATVPNSALRVKAENGNVESQYRLALLLNGGVNTEQDYTAAMRYFEMAAAQGHIDAAFMAGSGYIAARGVEQNPAVATKYLEQAAKGDHVRAQYMLGQTYLAGNLVPQERLWGLHWVLKAVKSGHAAAMTTLGAAYRGGLIGGSPDLANALNWLKFGSQNGDSLAGVAVGQVEAEISASGGADPVLPVLDPSGNWQTDILFRQIALAALGLDPGPLDGLPGKRTEAATVVFLKQSGLDGGIADDVGLLNQALRDALKKNAAQTAASATWTVVRFS